MKAEDSSEEDDDLDEQQYDRLEFIIGYLLDGLKDDENVVRWTAAKGIGRISMRMEQDFADQIVE
jgi:HEAT repeat protein